MRPAPAAGHSRPLHDAPALVAGLVEVHWLAPDGELSIVSRAEAGRRLDGAAPLLVHARATQRRLSVESFPALDLLELFAFVHPARFCVPTPRGLAVALDMAPPETPEAAVAFLPEAADRLLATLAAEGDRAALGVARAMARGGWAWGRLVLAALGDPGILQPADAGRGLDTWSGLPEWEEQAGEPPPGNVPVDPAAARRRLAEMLGGGAEDRPEQADYASAVSAAFQPRAHEDQPQVVLAEAGTGVGKTLGYLAPATLWSELNGGAVWIATYTRNLQHQIDGELDRLYPDPAEKARRVVIRKGRENYVCLLNAEEAADASRGRPSDAIALGLMARWIGATRDGDMVGGDFPAWLVHLLGHARTLGLADRRGECVYAACQHYHRCFIERSIRRARRADIVVANHALVMVQAALGGVDDTVLPARLVFDEGHHVFDAADSAFAAHLTGQEGVELRRWLLGAEGGRGRARGLRRRVEDLVSGDDRAMEALEAALAAAAALPGDGWSARVASGQPRGAAEAFLALVRQQVYARAHDRANPYSMETEVRPPVEGLVAAAATLAAALERLARPLEAIVRFLLARRDDEADSLDGPTRLRIEATVRGLRRRIESELRAWRAMLDTIPFDQPPGMVDWFAVGRIDGQDVDLGMYRHCVDPTQPFAEAVLKPAHGVLVTSATLTDGTREEGPGWAAAEERTGTAHLASPAIRARVPSPFDYARQTRVLVATDVARDDMDAIGAAYRALFLASGGGALGLFTAIARLRAVHRRLAGPLESAGLPLYAQHVDGLDTATLIDIFRAEEDACLLGTDAIRDGVDVPGRALRLIVFDRVPWPRPDILHKARRARFGTQAYDDRLTRFRLRQAFGRLIRRADDCGVFVLLDRAFPSRLHGAFPEGVRVERLGLADAVEATRDFLAHRAIGPGPISPDALSSRS